MFEKTRRKIFLSIAGFLILFLIITLSTVYISSYLSVRKENREMLVRYIDMYSLKSLPGQDHPPNDAPLGVNLPPRDNAMYKLSSFYSVAFGNDGEVIAVDAGMNGIYENEDILALAERISDTGKREGRIERMLYRVEPRKGYTLVAFMDTTLTDDNFTVILVNTLVAGLAAMFLLSLGAAFIAKRIVKPLEENDIRQKTFVSDAGHELKTPVSVISANADILSRQLGDNEWLSNIQYENERMGNLVKELLDLSRTERKEIHTEIIDLSELINSEVLPFEGVAFEHGLSINTDIEEEVYVNGDVGRMGQLISILVDNAISHNDNGDSIEVIMKKERRNAVLRVVNSGEPIPESERERIFDRFARLDEARSDNGSHYGLGLSIAKAIAESMGGKIRVLCEKGKVIFEVILPVKK